MILQNRSHCALMFGLLVVAASTAFAQSTTGSVYGNVADTSGALVPGATVTVTDVAKKTTQTTKSNGSGEYVFPTLAPGNYDVTLQMTGFRSVTQTGVALSANQNVHVNFALQAGAMDENVTVSASVTLVDTRESQLGETIDQQRVQELPLNGRNAYDLVTITPGVTNYSPDTSTGSRTGASLSINGLPTNTVSYYIDGAYNNAFYQNGGNLVPNPDALLEFRILTSNFDAEFGRSPGGVVNLITRSGSSALHGMVYDYLRNDVLNAKNYFQTSVTPLKQNQFGANLGGPMLGGGRAFYFASYEGLRVHTPTVIGPKALITATALERTGDFRKSANVPTTGCNGIIGTVCPDAVALRLLSFVPVYDPVAAQTVQQSASANTTLDQGLARLDLNLFDRHQDELLFFNSRGVNSLPGVGGNQILSYAGAQNYENQVNTVIADTWTISPTALNTARGFYTQNRYIIGNLFGNHYLSDLGSSAPNGGVLAAPPRIAITGYWNMGTDQTGPSDISQLSFGAVDTVNLTLGHHSIKAGGAFVYNKYSETGGLRAGGTFAFAGGNTPTANKLPNPLADFIAGKPTSLIQTNSVFHRNHNYDPSLFVQDDYQILPRLSLNLGLRWEVFAPFVGDNSLGTFVPNKQSAVFLAAPLGLVYQGDAGVANGIYNTPYNTFAPRIGFAFDPLGDGRTSLRGGFGIFYALSNETATGNLTQQPFGLNLTTSKPASLVNPYAPGVSPFPFAFNPAKPSFTSGAAITAVPTNGGVIPWVEEYNLTVEQQLGSQWATRIAYVGNASRRLYIQQDINAPAFVPGAATTTAGINARRPYQPSPTTFTFGAINLNNPANNGTYNGLQVTLRGRYRKSFTLLTSYVWAKSFNFGTPFVSGANIALNRGDSDTDVRNRFTLSALYHLPDVHFGGRAGQTVLGGWQLNGLVTLASGSPFTVISGVDTNLDGTVNDRADIVGNPYVGGGRSRAARIKQYLNPAAFAVPSGPYGNEQRNQLTGPGNINANLSVFKMFPIYREATFQFRLEAFNALGNVNLNNPATSRATLLSGTQQITGSGPARILQVVGKIIF